ncbi:MAG TPA: SgcJ/EcaC family oxidoreductase [Steroidobacteraceae bacterium]
MKLLIHGLFAALMLANPASGQTPAPADRTADREKITAILARWEHAWNTHDMEAFGSMFHEDGTWILWTGAVWVGRQAIADGHAKVHETIFRHSIQRELLEELTFVGPDAAVVRFCSALTGDARAPDKFVRSRKFLVVTRRAGVWGVSWGQNTRLADTVPDSECFIELRKRSAGAQTQVGH